MRRQILLIAFPVMVLFGLWSCSKEDSEPDIKPLDYTLAENWLHLPSSCQHEVDVFYLYPTSTSPTCTEIVSPVDEYMKSAAYNNYLKGPVGLEYFANVFAPYYRQVSGVGIIQCSTPEELTAMDRTNEPWIDVKAALDEFFAKYNSGRPFILASHSQGSSMMKIVLSEYMVEHPDYLKRMIAAYTLGFRFNKEWVEANPHLKMASGELDTGVIITFEAEGPNNDPCFPILGGTLSINPLNWKPMIPRPELNKIWEAWKYPVAFRPTFPARPMPQSTWLGAPSSSPPQRITFLKHMASAEEAFI